jgi:hypothetical protein
MDALPVTEPPETGPHLSAREEEEMARLLRLTPEEAANELRAVGIDPDELTRRLWEKCKAQLAKTEENRQPVKAPD